MDFNTKIEGLDPAEEQQPLAAAPVRKSSLDFNTPITGLDRDTVLPEIVAEDAFKTNPQQFKQQKDLARKTGLPVDVVASDDGSLANSIRAKEMVAKLSEAPAALKWFGVPDNAKAAHQDTDYLVNAAKLAVGLYQAQDAAVDWTSNVARGAGEGFFNRVVGGQTRFLGTVADSLADYLEANVLDLGRIEYNFTGSGPVLRWRASTPEDIAKESPLLKYARDFEKVKLGYKATTTWEDFKDSPAVNFIPFALETGLVSLPDMVAALANLPAYIMSLSGDLAQKRAQNDGRVDATIGDILNAMPYAIASALLEKIGAKGILGIGINDALKGTGKKAVAKAVGKGAIKEGVTEGIQEPVQYAGETLGTIKGFKIDEAIQRSLQGIVVGTGFGGSIRTGTAIAESQTKSRQARERADGFRELNATESALRDTDPEAWADFQSSMMEDAGVDGVRLSEEGAELLMQEMGAFPEQLKLDLTPSLSGKMDASSGTSLSPQQFWKLPKETIDKLAEHVSFDVNQMSAVEAEEVSSLTELMSSEGFMAEVAAELASVEVDTDLFVEIEQSIMQTGGALTADPAAARAAAQQMAAVFTTMAKRTGVPLQKIKDRFLPRIEGATGQPAAADGLTQEGGFAAYRKLVDPAGRTIPAEDRPNLRMGDMYGMLPKDAEVVGELDDVTLHRGANGDYYATAYNADLGEQDVVGFIQGRENGTELAVVEEMQGKGIGSELQYLFRRENPLAPTGGLTEAGASRLESTYDRLAADGILIKGFDGDRLNGIDPNILEQGAGNAENDNAGTGAGGGQEGVGAAPAALSDAPRVEGATGPLRGIHEVARRYARSAGRRTRRQGTYVEVDEDFARRIAQAYEDMPNDVRAPGVARAYEALIRETLDQYEALVAAGYTFSFIDPENDPYQGNPWNAMRDLHASKHLAVYPTTAGFGSDAEFDATQNPLLRLTDLVWDGPDGPTPVMANDVFRAVHDVFGHGMEGAGFRARGEENAWQAHANLFSDAAIPALTSETRGQNAWLNFGPHAATNQTAKVGDTVFADQKIGLLPAWAWTENRDPGKVLPVTPDGTVRLTHFSTNPDTITETDPSFYGQGIAGEEAAAKRSYPDQWVDRTYFGIDVGEEGGYRSEFDANAPRYKTEIDAESLYDFQADPLGLRAKVADKFITQRRPDGNHLYDDLGVKTAYEKAIKDAGFKGYFTRAQQGMSAAVFENMPVQRVATVQDPASLGLTAEEAARVNPIYRAGALPTKRLASNENAAKWLEEQFEGDAITDFTATLSTEQLDQLGRMMAAEVQLALESTGNAADWYSGAVLKAITAASIKYPMLTDDAAAEAAGFGTSSNARFAFTYIMAVTSQNLDVSKNSTAADAAFSEMVEMVAAGDYSMKGAWGTGDKQAAMAKNFKKFKPMLDAMRGDTPQDRMTALDRLFRQKKTVKEWVVSMKAAGIPYSPPGNTAMDVVVYGSSTLGPKIGNGFWQNLNGNFDPLTIDLWMRRTWGRLTGKSIGLPSAIPAQRQRLKAAVAKSRSDMQGAPDIIDIARAELDTALAAQASHKAQAGTTNQTKKDFDAETRRLNKVVRDGEALLSDMAGLKAPEAWKAEYGKTDAALLAYSKRLLKAWNVEYKSLQKRYGKGSIPDELQPTWARAAKAIRANLSTPLDQITNGTQRKQVEAAGARAIEILSERGIDVTTADMQALLWYPEKELWGALRDKLEVDDNGVPIVTASALNESYDTAFARIFRSQGYEVEGIEGDGAGGSGQRAVAGQDARLVEPGDIRGAGQAGGAVGRRELFQEVDFVGDVIFEVAPDPNNVELSARWNALPPAAQLALSDTVSKSVLPSVLEAAGADGSVFSQIGSYLDDTNPSFSLRLTSGDPAAVARAVGFVLSQDSMVALSADAFDGSFEAGAVRIQIGDKSLQEIDGIYQTLRGIEGFPQIGGQSTTDGQMTLILEEGVDRASFSEAVDKALTSAYSIETTTVNAAFPEKKDYDYARERDDPAGAEGLARQRYRAVRDQASQELAAAIDQYERGGQQPPAAGQQLGSGARGSIEGARPTDVQDIVIRLYKAENLSTFLHESGHLYLKMLGTLASDPDAPQQVKDDFAGVLKFLDVKSEGEIGTAQHEKWAETYEQYLRDGKAPSQELRSAFSKFSAWLTTLYRSIKSIGTGSAALNKDIAGVMDRLLATDEQIANVQSEMRMAPIFKDAEAAGMTDEAFAEYKQRYEDAREAAREELVQEAFAETRRERTEWWREELKTETDRVLAGMDTDPAWRTRAIIQTGVLPSGAPLPEVYPPRMKLNKAATAEYGHDLPGGNQLFARDGVSPDRAAQDLGYETGDQMLYELSQLPKDENGRFLTAKQFADQQAREYMLQEHGDIMNPDEMHEEALMKVHSRRQAQVILDELRLLNRKAGGRDSVTNAAARNAAEQAMSEKTISEIGSPTKYLNAERRFSMKAAEAVIAGDIDAALRFKTQQLLNFHMYRTARDMRMKADKMIATLNKRSRQKMDPKRVEPSFITQIKGMVSGIDFSSRMSQNRQAALSAETLQNWADQQSLKYGATFHISPALDRALSKMNVRDFTFSELEGLHDTVKSVYTQGLRYADAQSAQFNSIVQNMGYDIDANAKKKVPFRTGQRTKWEGAKSFVRLAFAEHRHILSLSEELDGYEQNGSVYSNVYQPIKRADDRYIDRSMKAAQTLNKILRRYTKSERLGFLSKKYIPELRGTSNPNLSRNERLAFGLNMGNAGNVAVMKDTYTDAQIDAVMATLTDKDVDVIESIWEQVDSYWPELSALEERTTGVKPAKVEPSPFELPSGRKVKGGYYPLLADPNADRNSKEQYISSQSLQSFSSGGKTKVSTKHGSTIERQGFGKRPVWLDLRGLFEHIDGVVKDIEMREAVADVSRIIRSKPFEQAVRNAKGAEFYEMFNNWLEHTVGASKPPITTVEKMSQYARTGASIAEMGLSVRTVLMQPFGFTSTVALLEEKYAAKGLAEFIGQRGGAVRKVMEASAFMRNRSATFNRDVREANRWMGVDSLKQDVVNASFWGIQKLDMAVSIPTWLGAYQKAIDEGRPHDDAVDFADQTVSRGQGTGLPRDMADIQQGPVWKKMFTMFYSYFGAYQNMQTDQWKQTNFKNPAQAMKYAKNQMWITIIPSIAVDALFNQLFSGDDDEMLWAKIGGSIMKTLFGGIVFVRDVANLAASGFKFDYQLTPAGNPIKEAGNLAKQIGPSIEAGELSTPLIKSLIMFTGYTAQLPGARQASRAYSVVADEDTPFEIDELESWYRVLVTGPKRQ